ncbi:MAG: LPS export ABC transporter periplasmic protein LptC [Candidatus Omnitrophica bacterium]|nr:LPS export ABC transporter periplasmic protein LptC [Candidatus Omnitrophota bacterium]
MNLQVILFIVVIISYLFGAPAFSQQKITDFNLSNFREDGKKDWEMRGQEAFIFEEYVDIRQMEARHYRAGRIIDIKADKGMLYKPHMDAYLYNNVEARSNDGAALFTDSLIWKKDKNLIYTNDPVRLTRDASEIRAVGMNADTELEKVNFLKDVTVRLKNEQSPDPVVVQCEGPLAIDYLEGVGVFQHNVRVSSEEGTMYSDRATIFFDAQQKVLKKVISEGNVEIFKGDNVTLAEKATYVSDGGQLMLEGSPHLTVFPDEITGN